MRIPISASFRWWLKRFIKLTFLEIFLGPGRPAAPDNNDSLSDDETPIRIAAKIQELPNDMHEYVHEEISNLKGFTLTRT